MSVFVKHTLNHIQEDALQLRTRSLPGGLEGRLGIATPRCSADPRFRSEIHPPLSCVSPLLQLLFIVVPQRCKCRRNRWMEGTSHHADTVFMQSQVNRARERTGRARRPSESETPGEISQSSKWRARIWRLRRSLLFSSSLVYVGPDAQPRSYRRERARLSDEQLSGGDVGCNRVPDKC